MKIIIAIIISAILISCSDFDTSKLEDKEQTIEFSHIAWACDCADWATSKDIESYHDMDDTLAKLSVFIEPADNSLTLPDTLGYNNDVIVFTGQFYKDKGFPDGYQSFENPDKAKVFRYTKYQVVKSNYKYSKADTQRQKQ